MPAIVKDKLGSSAIVYNGIQFGGSEALYSSTPPNYTFQGSFVYDQSRRAVKGTKYTLSVRSIFTDLVDTKDTSKQFPGQYIRDKLSEPRKLLQIDDLGLGFREIDNDDDWGPKPINIEFIPLGPSCWEVHWTVEFFVKDCQDARKENAWNKISAFNFETTWSNNYEGLVTRSIFGYAEIALKVQPNQDGSHTKPAVSVEQLRRTLDFAVPNGFRRTQNTWREHSARNRLDFNITDEVLPGQAPPPGCISCSGDFTWQGSGAGLTTGVATLNMLIRVRPGIDPSLAGAVFINACNSKQKEMLGGLSSKESRGTLVPTHMAIKHTKYDESRVTMGTMSWSMTASFQEIIQGLGIWSPLSPDNYSLWRASIQDVWQNRGVSVNGTAISSNPNDGIVIDLCDAKEFVNVGNYTPPSTISNPQRYGTLAKPVIMPGNSWLRAETKPVFSWVIEGKGDTGGGNAAVHIKAAPMKPGEVRDVKPDEGDKAGKKVGLNIPTYTQDPNTYPVVEYLGHPVLYLSMNFRGMRALYTPVAPVVKSVGGNKATLCSTRGGVPRAVFDAMVPIWYMERTDVYRIDGVVNGILPSENLIVTDANNLFEENV